MATLVFSAIGTLLGGPIGGAIGALAGRQVDGMIFRPGARQGPRLAELTLSGSSYGLAVPRHYGRIRTGGQVIWSTDLVEQQNAASGGKGRPATVTYAYSASFAVALSSRPITDIGRIWADGKLLRGAAGDLKVGGAVRIHHGHGDQQCDPLLAGAEGSACPAYRGLAYVVFEDLQLAEYGNRIPALSFEVIADSGTLDLQAMLDPVLPDCDAAVPLEGLIGMTMDGSPADLLAQLDPLFPVDCDACDTRLTIRPERSQPAVLTLAEPAVAGSGDDFGGKAGFTRTRALAAEPPISVLRYYDAERDYQPGTQRARRMAGTGEPRMLELQATLAASSAQALVQSAARRLRWSRHVLAWRVTELNPDIAPGAVVALPNEAGTWRVKAWEWRSAGIELALERIAPPAPPPTGPSDPGRVGSDPDLVLGGSSLTAFELPWDGNPATPVPQLFAAAGPSGGGWDGAALYVDQGDGSLRPIGSTGRRAAISGTAIDVLPPGTPLLFDRTGSVTILLTDPAAALDNATLWQLAQGANRALLGDELIQFGTATPLGAGRWRLSGLLRGRGGTEGAIAGHASGIPFVLLDSRLAPLDPALVGPPEQATIAAIGLGDPIPALSPVRLAGIGWRPLAPVHGVAAEEPDGTLQLRWTRRSRGGWQWEDSVDLPLNEQRESYLVDYGQAGFPVAQWDCSAPQLGLPAAEWAALRTQASAGVFSVRQVGDRAVSPPLTISPSYSN